MTPLRYSKVLSAVASQRPSRILEIGTCRGDRAVEMIQTAIKAGVVPSYFGFDLFESLTPDDSKREFNVKVPLSAEEVRKRILKEFPNVHVEVFKGLTKDTLPKFVQDGGAGTVDFVWLDGGHSVETVKSDWEWSRKALRHGGQILLDDFYSEMPEDVLSKFGCNALVWELRHDPSVRFRIHKEKDPVNGGGKVQIVEVTFVK